MTKKTKSTLDQALRGKENNVLVHCSAGISRSPTLVLAYMMKRCNFTLDEAFDRMRQLRSIVDPNVSFIIQLRDWEKLLAANSETTDDAALNTCSTSRTTSSIYCGSTSKNKNETKPRSDAVIPVN
jgi:protein-tyrosine phosphatase